MVMIIEGSGPSAAHQLLQEKINEGYGHEFARVLRVIPLESSISVRW